MASKNRSADIPFSLSPISYKSRYRCQDALSLTWFEIHNVALKRDNDVTSLARVFPPRRKAFMISHLLQVPNSCTGIQFADLPINEVTKCCFLWRHGLLSSRAITSSARSEPQLRQARNSTCRWWVNRPPELQQAPLAFALQRGNRILGSHSKYHIHSAIITYSPANEMARPIAKVPRLVNAPGGFGLNKPPGTFGAWECRYSGKHAS
ncbi:hypothetical protein F5Y13DRAFT_65774 [Hypoxylon sp. FL1857]|nr:hypothetical protein F5Y13DRAFT_65774 [Hypoxylon sp. FL1857]